MPLAIGFSDLEKQNNRLPANGARESMGFRYLMAGSDDARLSGLAMPRMYLVFAATCSRFQAPPGYRWRASNPVLRLGLPALGQV